MKTDSKLPGPLYLDASALLKVYLPEPESEVVDGLLQGRDDLLVSDLAITEIVSAAARRRREGQLTVEQVQQIRGAILKDVKEGFYRRLDLLAETFRRAELIIISLESTPLRALDGLHLSLAAGGEGRSIVTFDRRLAKAAILVGFQVWGGSLEEEN